MSKKRNIITNKKYSLSSDEISSDFDDSKSYSTDFDDSESLDFNSSRSDYEEDDRFSTIKKNGKKIYICNLCKYPTDKKSDIIVHVNKKIPCEKGDFHRNRKKMFANDNFVQKNDTSQIILDGRKKGYIICEVCCDGIKHRTDNYYKHLGTRKHINNSQKNVFNVPGNYNTIIGQQIINIHLGPDSLPHLLNCLTYNINDLSLFQQYLMFSFNVKCRTTPYTTLLDYLNLNSEKKQYNNIKYDYDDDVYKMYMNSEWAKISFNSIQNLADAQRALLCKIFDKFRFFLSRKASVFGIKYLFYGLPDSGEQDANNQQIWKYILLHKMFDKPKFADSDIPKRRDNPIWLSLSKRFTFREVFSYITKMTDIGIDFSKNVNQIDKAIKLYIKRNDDKTKNYAKFFSKLLNRFEFLKWKKKQIILGNGHENPDTSEDEMERCLSENPTDIQIPGRRKHPDVTNSCYPGFYGAPGIAIDTKEARKLKEGGDIIPIDDS